MLKVAHDALDAQPKGPTCIAGDFNAIADPEDLYDLVSNRATGKDFEKRASAYDPPLIEKWRALRLAVIYGVTIARKAKREGGLGWLGEVMCA